jgi:hypothetical protein
LLGVAGSVVASTVCVRVQLGGQLSARRRVRLEGRREILKVRHKVAVW